MPEFHRLMNNTKWDELRLAIYVFEPPPRWQCMTTTGHYSASDTEWFYHFRSSGYDDIRYVDIFAAGPTHREWINRALKKIHLPGEETAGRFRVYGYVEPGQVVDYL